MKQQAALEQPLPGPVMVDFEKFRIDLNRYLLENAEGYSLIRAPNWSGVFLPHITVGYIVNPLSAGEIDKYINALSDFNAEYEPVSFILTKGVVMAFNNMDIYYPI